MENKTYHLTLNNLPLTLTLTPPPSWGYCVGCWKDKAIRVISKKANSLRRKFCQSCALEQLNELATSNYNFQNREQTIEQIRSFLLGNYSVEEQNKEVFECYE